jgi:cell division septation protein DedD
VLESNPTVAQPLQDDGFREIQLNGKQLVFLFMAATVVSVVIFLSGVLVGRGVKAERLIASDLTPAAAAAETTSRQSVAVPAPAAGSDPTAAAPPPAVDDLSYYNRLEKQKAQPEQLKPQSKGETAKALPEHPKPESKAEPLKTATAKAVTTPPPPKAQPETKSTPAPAPAASTQAKEPARATSAASSTQDATGPGFAVQIAALNVRSEAEAIAKRLSSKGYSAYVMSPPAGTPSVFRVRVGKFSTRREADTVAARLQKEEQFKPWVTR